MAGQPRWTRAPRGAGFGTAAEHVHLDGPGFAAADLHPLVREFYEHTASWRLDVWSHWWPPAWPAGWLISAAFARRLEQLSLPLRPLDVAHGMTSEVTPVVDDSGAVIGTRWHRGLRATGQTVYSGWYGSTELAGSGRRAVRVCFPLPDGRLVVLLRPAVTPTGGLVLFSGAGEWGQEGASWSSSRSVGPRGGRGGYRCSTAAEARSRRAATSMSAMASSRASATIDTGCWLLVTTPTHGWGPGPDIGTARIPAGTPKACIQVWATMLDRPVPRWA